MSRVLIVVPCYNEERRLDRKAFLGLVNGTSSVSVLFVNDGSSDGTESILRELCAEAPDSLQFVTLPKNSGKAEAVRQGMVRGLSSDGPDLVGYWDADLATPLPAIRDFVTVMDRDSQLLVVMGARAQLLGRTITRRASRHYLGRVFATVASLVLKLPVYDTQCGAKLFRNDPLVRRLFGEPFLSKWIFDVELLARLRVLAGGSQLRRCVYELALREWQDVAGSKLGAMDYVMAMRDMWRIWLMLRSTEENGRAAPG